MPVTAKAEAPSAPEYFRLPTKGRDPHFGLSRSWFYQAEARGWLRLIRIKHKGTERGIVLIRHADVLNFIRAKEAESKGRFDSHEALGAVRTGVKADG